MTRLSICDGDVVEFPSEGQTTLSRYYFMHEKEFLVIKAARF